MTVKERADVALVRRGICESREKAQAAIMAGEVYAGGRKINKASEAIKDGDELVLRGPEIRYVSRGALKLEKAIRVFHANLQDRIVMDIGASTGGFTDICLRNGAKRVYSVDVGYGQLDWKLRNDSRVTVMERTNARYLKQEDFDERPEITVMDVSFISIRLILPVCCRIMGEEGIIYTLIKPQFEAGREKVGKNGVVRDSETHEEVIRGVATFAEGIGWQMKRLDFSPITGPEGNIEFIAEIRKIDKTGDGIGNEEIRNVVELAHEQLHTKRQT
ncbi:MAG: TlyA family RNA methyltransferase [Clostridia bacterium]|nr:TlyA family RNA methyltransferase [Clostridia bacterium]